MTNPEPCDFRRARHVPVTENDNKEVRADMTNSDIATQRDDTPSWESRSTCGRDRAGLTPWNTTVLTCVNCRVKNECLDDALAKEMRGRVVMGVAGGLTQRERRSVLRLAASKQIILGSLGA